MIYYKITDEKSEAFKRHLKYIDQVKEARNKVSQIVEEYSLPVNFYIGSHGSITAFKMEGKSEDIPEGMRLKDVDAIIPDKRTSLGKKIAESIKEIDWPSASTYMKNIFGESGTAITNARSMTSGCTMKEIQETVIISVHPEVLDDAKKREGFNIPDGLIEITGSEYHELKAA